MRPHILLLTTGGTIASLPTAEGLAPGLDGEALAGLLPQGIMDCYDITIRDIPVSYTHLGFPVCSYPITGHGGMQASTSLPAI